MVEDENRRLEDENRRRRVIQNTPEYPWNKDLTLRIPTEQILDPLTRAILQRLDKISELLEHIAKHIHNNSKPIAD